MKHLIFLLIVTCVNARQVLNIQKGLTIVSATRNVDLTSQLVKVKVEYELANRGTTDVNFFLHTLSDNEAAHISWFFANEGKKSTSKCLVSQALVNDAPKGFSFYKIELLNLLAPGSTVTLNVEYIITSVLSLYPAEITQAENQLVLYEGSANVLSAYEIEKESTNYKIGNVKPISFTEQAPSKYSGDKLVYGPYKNEKPFSEKKITIHYENNAPFIVATNVERVIEVSHWGNIAIEENIEIVHKGAKLKGSFSRLDYQMDRRGNRQPVVKSLKTHLPRTSSNIYYRDQIGNISTSDVSSRSDRLEVELRPRFPLFGGWKTNYVIGYNVPTNGFLYSSGSNYALKIRLVDHLYDNSVIENLRVKIILPETCKNIKLITPYSVKRLPDQVHKTYLDVAGRPVIVFEKENLVNKHIQPLTVYYEFDRVSLLREPFLAVIAFLIVFLIVIVFFRLDFTIANKNKEVLAHAKKD